MFMLKVNLLCVILVTSSVEIIDAQLRFNGDDASGVCYGKFLCPSGTCIDRDKFCDTNNDCGSNEDEDPQLCGSQCTGLSDTSCPAGRTCVYHHFTGGSVFICSKCDPNCASDTDCSHPLTCNSACKPGYYRQTSPYEPFLNNCLVDYCASETCQNGGTCQNLVDSFECACPDGFDGTHCELVDHCATETCQQGGTCQNVEGGFECQCPTGFTGTHCQDEIVYYCTSKPCKNGAKCVELGDGYKCNCKTGHGGRQCQTKCDARCRGDSGCSFFGRGKCDTRCIKGYTLLPRTHKCRSNKCKKYSYRLRHKKHCGWVTTKRSRRRG